MKRILFLFLIPAMGCQADNDSKKEAEKTVIEIPQQNHPQRHVIALKQRLEIKKNEGIFYLDKKLNNRQIDSFIAAVTSEPKEILLVSDTVGETEMLKTIVMACKKHKVKLYLTQNTQR